jgi:hypothetical protein
MLEDCLLCTLTYHSKDAQKKKGNEGDNKRVLVTRVLSKGVREAGKQIGRLT